MGASVHRIGDERAARRADSRPRRLDMALHDLRGKWLNKPCYALLGGATRSAITTYASLQPDVSSFAAYRDFMVMWARDAQRRGFRAAKVEATFSGPYQHHGLHEPFERVTEVIAAVRGAVGADFTLMVDVQYAFPDADTCLATLRDWEEFNLFFVETPLPSDDLDGYARLAREQSIPIAAGEWLATRFEFLDLLDRGLVSIAQPDIGRVGGLTEARRVCDLAKARGRAIVPHAWKTGISIAAAAHLAFATEHCAYIEFQPAELCESALRRDLVADELQLVDGQILLPSKPGLGIELNRDALERFEMAAATGYGRP